MGLSTLMPRRDDAVCLVRARAHDESSQAGEKRQLDE